MSEAVSNVNILADTFEGWLNRHNQISHLMSLSAITANVSGANTGNSTVSRISQLWGTFGANTLVVTDGLRGGNVSTVNALPVVANLEVYVGASTGANVPVVKVGNSTVISTIDLYGLRAGNGTSNTVISNSSIISQSNTTVKSNITPTEINVANGAVNASMTPIGFVAGITGANQTHKYVGANVVLSSSSVTVGNSTLNAVMTSQELLVQAGASTSSIREDGISTSGTMNVSSNATFLGPIAANNTVSLANTLTVTGATSVNNTITIKTEYVLDVASNTNIGSNVTHNQLIFSFPKATYSSGKLSVQIKNGTNTQISEIVLAHNTSNAYLTVYGTVSSPPSGNSSPLLGVFEANINNANVELLIIQTQASSSAKIVGHLIK